MAYFQKKLVLRRDMYVKKVLQHASFTRKTFHNTYPLLTKYSTFSLTQSKQQKIELRQANWSIRWVSEKAILSHEAGRHFISNFTIKWSKSSSKVIGRRFFLSSFGVIHMTQGEVIYNLFPKFHLRQKRFTFYGPIKSVKRAYRDPIYNFCWPKHSC